MLLSRVRNLITFPVGRIVAANSRGTMNAQVGHDGQVPSIMGSKGGSGKIESFGFARVGLGINGSHLKRDASDGN